MAETTSVVRRESPAASRANADSTPQLESARAMAAEITSRAPEFETERRMPADLARKLAEAGLFRIAVAEAYAGAELHPADIVRVFEEVSRADGAAGWCLMIGGTTALISGFLPKETAREIYGDANVITGGAVAPKGKAVAADGGYLVSGRWQWGSGTQNCHWIVGNSILFDGERPRLSATGEPQVKLMVFPAKQVEILDTWYSSGLRGTGSHDFQVNKVFVPFDHALSLVGDPPVVDRPLYRFPFMGMLALGVCSVSLGIARRAIDEFTALAKAKTPTWERKTLADTSRVQSSVAEAEAELRSARAFVFSAIDAAWESAVAGRDPSLEIRRDLRLAAVNAAWKSARAVDLMYVEGGGSSVLASNPLQRCFRDVHTITQHVMVNPAVYEQAGKLYLGGETVSPLF